MGPESSRLTVNYRMGHTLKDMGLQLKPIDWTRMIVRRRSSSGSGSASPPNTPPTTPPVSPGREQSPKEVRSCSPKCEPSDNCQADSDNHGESQAVAKTVAGSSSSDMDTDVSDKLESRELKVDYSTTKIKEEPKDIAESITHIQLVATS